MWKTIHCFIQNGSLLFEDGIYNFGEYCIERVLKDDNRIETSVAVCLDNVIIQEAPNLTQYCGKYPKYKNIYICQCHHLFSIVYASLTFLILTLAIYAFIHELQSLRGKVLMCYMTTLTIFYILYIFLKFDNLELSKACTVVGYFHHSSTISSILLLNVISIDNFINQV